MLCRDGQVNQTQASLVSPHPDKGDHHGDQGDHQGDQKVR